MSQRRSGGYTLGASEKQLMISVFWYHWTVWGWEIVMYHANDGSAKPLDLQIDDRIMVGAGTAGWAMRNYGYIPFTITEGYVWTLVGGDWRAYPKATADLYGDEGLYNGGSTNSLEYYKL